MEWWVILVVGLTLLLAAFMTGAPIFVAFLLINIAGVLILLGQPGFGLVANSIFETTNIAALSAVPLFILMRALGIISDKEIMEYCLLDIEKYSHYLDSLRPSVHDAGEIFTQQAALKYIASLTKGKTVSHALQILMIYFIPHIGELNFKAKALLE